MAALSYTGMQMRSGQEEPLEHFVDVESSDSDASSAASDGGISTHRRRTLAYAAGISLVLICAFCATAVFDISDWWRHGALASSGRQQAELGEKVLIESGTSAAPGASAAATTPPPVPKALAAVTPEPLSVEPAVAAYASELAAGENLTDGNVCKDSEELFGGLCYKKCSTLTGGKNAIRTSPWTCCESHPCLVNQKVSIHAKVACTGFAIAGDGSCPHKPGACLGDEELFLGVCYKKCSLLTDREYPYRVTPATCCEDTGLSCLDFRKSYTSDEFAVGGGEDRPGACHEDEELLLGKCYKKCSLLTHNEYPLRFAFATCCKARSRLPHKLGGVWHLGCLDPRNDKSSAAFNVPGDEIPQLANTDPHYPLKALTEQE